MSQFNLTETNRSHFEKDEEPPLLQKHKALSEGTCSNAEELRKENANPIEYLQVFIKQLLPNLKDDNAVFVILVNNEKTLPEWCKGISNVTNFIPKVYGNDIEVNLRRKLAQKTQVAEERRKKIKVLLEAKRRLLKRNTMLKEIIIQLKTQNVLTNSKQPHNLFMSRS